MAKAWAWVSQEFKLAPFTEAGPGESETCTWIRSCGGSDGAETAIVRGAGYDVQGVTDPQYAPGEGSLECLSKPFRLWGARVTQNGTFFLSDFEWLLTITRKSRSESDALIDTFRFVITNLDDQSAQGSPDPLVIAVTTQIIQIKRNGFRL
jgi:hypothetical protein